MKNQITTIITAVSTCLATLSFLAIFNPTAIHLNPIKKDLNDTSSEITSSVVHEQSDVLNSLLFPEHNNLASSDPFLGQIIMFGGNFPPRGWAFCDGQLLSINSNQALFSLLGTIYGGDGRTSFALPDLRGRVPVHAGFGPGLSQVRLGEKGGVQSNTQTTVAGPGRTGNIAVPTFSAENRPPYQGVNYIIALQGTFPSRS